MTEEKDMQEKQEDTVETENESQEDAAVNDIEQQLAEAQKKAEENWDHFVRAKAEMENIRRRAERDLENAHKYGIEKFALELLPVKDSLELGLSAAQEPGAEVEKIREGIDLTLKMLMSAMEKYGISEVEAHGAPFNPEYHEALTMQPSDEVAPNTVTNVVQKGYLLNDRLIRPAKVVVSQSTGASGAQIDEKA